MSGGHCFRDTWHIFSGMLRGSFTSAGESSVPFWGVEGGESQGRVAPGDPEFLKKADISLMYFTEAEREDVRERERELDNTDRQKKYKRTEEGEKRNLGYEYGASRFGDELKTVARLKNSFKKVQKFICEEFTVT